MHRDTAHFVHIARLVATNHRLLSPTEVVAHIQADGEVATGSLRPLIILLVEALHLAASCLIEYIHQSQSDSPSLLGKSLGDIEMALRTCRLLAIKSLERLIINQVMTDAEILRQTELRAG